MNKFALAPTSLKEARPIEYIDAAAKAGYDGIGLRLFRSPGVPYSFYPVAGDAALEREVKSAIKASGMDVYDILSFYIQPYMDVETMLPALDFGAEIGAKYALVICDDQDWNRQVAGFAQVCEEIAKRGMIPSMEAPVVGRNITSMERAVKLFKDSGRTDAVLCLDPFHFARLSQTNDMISSLDPKLFPYTQLTDGKPLPGPRCALGEGMVDLYGFLDALPENIPFSLEWPADEGTDYTPAQWAKMALDGAKAYMNDYYASKK